MKRKEFIALKRQGYDLDFIAKTQPQGNVRIKSNRVEMGDGCVTCLHVYGYPKRDLTYFWLADLAQFDYTVTTISIGTEDKRTLLKSMERATDEKSSQVSSKQRTLDNINSATDANDQLELLKDISQRGEIMKRVYVRIFVYGSSRHQLDQRVDKIRESLEKFKLSIFQDEQAYEMASVLTPTMQQVDTPYKRLGTPISARVLGAGYLFNHIELDDPEGSYFGYTHTGGKVMFNPFHFDDQRTRPFYFTSGNPRMGKSSWDKKLNDDVFARSGFIRSIDVSGEYIRQTEDQNGLVVTLDGTVNRINLFEIFATATSEDGSEIDQRASFNQHSELLKNVQCFLNKETDDDDLGLLDELITDFYEKQNMWTKNPAKFPEKLNAIGLPHNQYPQLGEWVVYLKNVQLEKRRDSSFQANMKSINRIVSTWSGLLSTKGEMFDGPTTMPDFEFVPTVTFEAGSLLTQGIGVFNAQIFAVLSMIQSHLITNGKKYRRLVDQGKIDNADVPRYWINFDEAQNYLNRRFAKGVLWLADLMQQMAKNYCGVNFTAPTIKDIIPEVASNSEYDTAIEKIFGMFQYLSLFQLSEADIDRVDRVLGNTIARDDLEGLPKQRRGEVLFVINGYGTVPFNVELTPEESHRYTGGNA